MPEIGCLRRYLVEKATIFQRNPVDERKFCYLTYQNLNTALCLTIRYNSRGGKKEKNETLLPRYASKDR
jgi:hypothetical protein